MDDTTGVEVWLCAGVYKWGTLVGEYYQETDCS